MKTNYFRRHGRSRLLNESRSQSREVCISEQAFDLFSEDRGHRFTSELAERTELLGLGGRKNNGDRLHVRGICHKSGIHRPFRPPTDRLHPTENGVECVECVECVFTVYRERVNPTPSKKKPRELRIKLDPETHRVLAVCSFLASQTYAEIITEMLEDYLKKKGGFEVVTRRVRAELDEAAE